VHSAGMLIVDRTSWPLTDLRVDWHETDPIGELRQIWRLWRPQMDDYITRACPTLPKPPLSARRGDQGGRSPGP
jgi:uncharacterized Ntn-hydrolase superfamily protein